MRPLRFEAALDIEMPNTGVAWRLLGRRHGYIEKAPEHEAVERVLYALNDCLTGSLIRSLDYERVEYVARKGALCEGDA